LPPDFKYGKNEQKFKKNRFSHYAKCAWPCFVSHISAVNRAIPVLLQGSIDVRHVYGVTKNRGSKCENAPTTTGQTCDIVQYSSYRERSYEGPCLACDIWAVNRDIPVILQGSIEVRYAYRMAKNRGFTSENAVTIKRQTCGIVRCPAHVGNNNLLLERRKGCR